MEGFRGRTTAKLYVFNDPDGSIAKILEKGAPVDIFKEFLIMEKTIRGNVFLIEGVNAIWKLATGIGGVDPFGPNACIGVGDGTTPESPIQTGLLGTNKAYKKVDSGYPKITDNKVEYRATFGPDEAVFDWHEWTVANGCGDEYINLNRKVEDLGRKSANTTAVLHVIFEIV